MKSLALCMIVKNEEEMLGGCLESIKDVVDEMIVVDTGSTDNTKQIARAHGAKVFDFEWINDFAAARNFSKAQTDCDYVMALDADERFHSIQGQSLRDSLSNQDAPVCFIRLSPADSITDTVEDVLEKAEQTSGFTFLPRILKNIDDNDWVGRVHEAPSNTRGATYINVDIVHLGHDKEYRIEHKKGERNLRLLEEILKDDSDQFPLFYSYLAMERKAIGDQKGFVEALELGWESLGNYINKDISKGVYNSGVLSTYPAVLLAQGKFQEGLKALIFVIEHLPSFSANAANTLCQVLGSCIQLSLPKPIKALLFPTIIDATKLLLEFDEVTFAEPTLEGVTSYKALQMQAYCYAQEKDFDTAFTLLDKAYAYEEALYSTQLLHIEVLIEQGDLQKCLTMYTDILQKNLHTSPDVWVLGALLLLVMGQESDVEDYLDRAMAVVNNCFHAPHRVHLFKGLYTRQLVMKGTPCSGTGAYGVIGAILSRETVKSQHQIPSTLIVSVVDRYLELNKTEALLPFFDERAEEILPGAAKIVRDRLEAHGILLEDDGQKTPVIFYSEDCQVLETLLEGHDSLQVVEFTEEEIVEITTELNAEADMELDDLLFGSLDFLDESEQYQRTKELFEQKFSGMTDTPLLKWESSWDLQSAQKLYPDANIIVYIGDPQHHAKNSEELYTWHTRNLEVLSDIGEKLIFLNAKQFKAAPLDVLNDLMAKLGIRSYKGTDEFSKEIVWDPYTLNEIVKTDVDRELLTRWKFL